jgi:hypothetical protein
VTGANGHDRGALGFPLRPDHAAEDRWRRRVGCAFLAALCAGVSVGILLCGAVTAVWWRW